LKPLQCPPYAKLGLNADNLFEKPAPVLERPHLERHVLGTAAGDVKALGVKLDGDFL